MKTYAVAVALAAAALIGFGSPFVAEAPARVQRWQSAGPLLPMRFAHEDHRGENCVLCHHNYVDGSGGDPCMYCHVTNVQVSPALETQFHDLCRGCHSDKAQAGQAGGPVRACIECHVEEDEP